MCASACVYLYMCVTFFFFFLMGHPSRPPSRYCRLPYAIYCATSFNNSGKKARDIGLTFRQHLSNIMPDSIFHGSMFQGITCLLACFFCLFVCLFACCFFRQEVVTMVFPRLEDMDAVFCQYNTSGHEETLSQKGLRQVGLISF